MKKLIEFGVDPKTLEPPNPSLKTDSKISEIWTQITTPSSSSVVVVF
jgi:hypothetical protein